MSDAPAAAPPAEAPARRRPRLAWISLGTGLLLCGWIVGAGTIATTTITDPRTPDDGALVALVLTPDGRKEVRCARVMPFAPDLVWATLTDYARYPEVFKEIVSAKATRIEGGVAFDGVARVPVVGTQLPYQVRVAEKVEGDVRSLSWDEPSGRLTVNRGSWTVRPATNGTLVVHTTQVESRGVPNFLIRDGYRLRLPAVMRELEAAARARVK